MTQINTGRERVVPYPPAHSSPAVGGGGGGDVRMNTSGEWRLFVFGGRPSHQTAQTHQTTAAATASGDEADRGAAAANKPPRMLPSSPPQCWQWVPEAQTGLGPTKVSRAAQRKIGLGTIRGDGRMRGCEELGETGRRGDYYFATALCSAIPRMASK